MKRPEILAPVGGKEQLYAAVRAGADAVYLGGKGFNTRRNAENFEELTLKEAVNYCHARGVKVYATVNTLVTDDEIQALRAEIRSVAEAGVDGVMVQDFAVYRIFKTEYPQVPLFASTQMAAHNAEGVQYLEELGFSRAVMARELTLEEIRAIRKATNRIGIESFVHGAHCMSLSGGCYLSSMIGGRSGNRGLCAQPCRLDFVCKDRRNALSLKDMCYLPHTKELADAGVCSFKIEGRMKRPEYVAAAVDAYKDALDTSKPLAKKQERLQAVFSRSGFTDGYLVGKRDAEMFGTRTKEDVTAANTVFAELGELYRNEPQNVAVDMVFTAGLGEPTTLTATDGEHWVTAEAQPAEAAKTTPMTKASIRESLEKTGGTPFYLNELTCSFQGELALPKSALNGLRREVLDALLDERAYRIAYKHYEPDSRDLLSRIGSPGHKPKDYVPAACSRAKHFPMNSPATQSSAADLPATAAKEIRLRVETIEQFYALAGYVQSPGFTQTLSVAETPDSAQAPEAATSPGFAQAPEAATSHAFAQTPEAATSPDSAQAPEAATSPDSAQAPSITDLSVPITFIVPVALLKKHPEILTIADASASVPAGIPMLDTSVSSSASAASATAVCASAASATAACASAASATAAPTCMFRIYGELPTCHFPAQADSLKNTLQTLREQGFTDLCVDDLGGIYLAKQLGFRVHGGQGLNILNTIALAEYEALGLADATISFELAASKIKKLGTTLPRGILTYGCLPLMHMRSCPARTRDGCKGCTGRTPMTDRKGEKFTVLCREKQYADLLNCVPLYIADKPEIPLDFETLYFTTEAPDETVSVLKSVLKKQAPDFRRTTGLYWRDLL